MTVAQSLSRLGQAVLDTLFPPRCAACGRYGEYLCGACSVALPRAMPPRCPICWQPQAAGDHCWRCQRQPPAYRAVRSPFPYEGPVRRIVHAFKYNDVSALARPMASLMADCLHREFPSALTAVPVPLFPRRQRRRGYNQAALLARELARLCGLPLAEAALVRQRSTEAQARLTGQAAVEARRANVAGAFAGRPGLLPPAAAVLLVDDVMTSGATLDACARALAAVGAGEVYGLVFARED